ncbi:hypothetical protein CXT97_04710 [Akkermansia muciniphila]|nr:hypothetical protein CXT97_04710 [Akkermansia muciniphila]PNC98443.1 hypothetical protein CXT90_11775 [Akkermansia muciniphila]
MLIITRSVQKTVATSILKCFLSCGVSSENVRSPHPHPPRCKQESSHPATFPSPGRMQQRKTKESTQQQKAKKCKKNIRKMKSISMQLQYDKCRTSAQNFKLYGGFIHP